MPPTRLKRDESKAKTRALLLEAAARVFARRGFHGASVEEIAEVAGFSTGALYSNFSGKEDLFLALLDEEIAEDVRKYHEIFERARGLDEQARGGADEWMRELQRDPQHFALFIEFWAYAARDPELRRKFAARFGAFREAFGRMAEKGAAEMGVELDSGAAEQLGTIINALGNGIALEKVADPDAVPDELLGDVLSFLFQSLLAAAARGEFGELARAK